MFYLNYRPHGHLMTTSGTAQLVRIHEILQNSQHHSHGVSTVSISNEWHKLAFCHLSDTLHSSFQRSLFFKVFFNNGMFGGRQQCRHNQSRYFFYFQDENENFKRKILSKKKKLRDMIVIFINYFFDTCSEKD